MKYLRPKDAARLAEYSGPACVTMYMPLAGLALGPELRQDRTRLKNLVRQAHEKLSALPHRPQSLVERLDLITLAGPQPDQAPGLVWFLTTDFEETYALPEAPIESVTVAKEFDLTTAASLSWRKSDFYVLSVSQRQVRLWHGDNEGLYLVELAGLPDSLPDALWYKESEKLLQNRHGAGSHGAGSYHGQGEDTREPRANLNEYLHLIEKVVTKHLERSTAPLVLAGSEPTLGMYRKVNSYPNLIDETVTTKPEATNPQELYHRARQLVYPLDQLPRQQALEDFRRIQATAPERATTDISRLVQAAETGRVDTLFVSSVPMAEFFESLDQSEGSQEVASVLIKQITRHTLKNSGKIYSLQGGEIPGAQIAAILRY